MISGGIQAGRAFVDVYAKTARMEKKLREAEGTLRKWVRNTGYILAGSGAAVFAGLVPAIQAASNRAETLNAFKETFRGANDEANRLADTMSRKLGRSATQLALGMTPIGAMARGLGMGADQAARFSARVVQAALDISSFYNEDTEATFQRLRSALSGSSEAVDQFGINLRAGALSLKLQELGFDSNLQKATELEKTIARLALVEEALSRQGAAGDLERTAKQFANSSRTLGEAWREMMANIGRSMLPLAEKLTAWLTRTVQKIAEFIDQHPGIVQMTAAFAAARIVIGGALVVIGSEALKATLALAALTKTGMLVGGMLANSGMLAPLLTVVGNMASMGQKLLLFLGQFRMLNVAITAVATTFRSFGAIIGRFGSLIGGVKFFSIWATGILAVVGAMAYLQRVSGFLTPFVTMFRESMEVTGQVASKAGNLIARVLAPALALIQDIWDGLKWDETWAAFGEDLKIITETFAGALLLAVQAVAGALSMVIDLLDTILVQMGLIDPDGKLAKKGTEGEKADAALEDIRVGLGYKPRKKPGSAAPGEEPEAPVDPEAAALAAEQHEQLKDFATNVIEDTLTPLEQFTRHMGQLNAAFKAGLLTQDQYNRAVANARKDLQERSTDPRVRAMLQVAQQVTEDQMTEQEKYNREMARLSELLQQGMISQETYARAVEAENNRLAESEAKRKEKEQQVQDDERDKIKASIEKRTSLELKAAKTSGDHQRELAVTFKKYRELSKNGFAEEAVNTYVDAMGMIIDRSNDLQREVKQQKDNAAFVTTSISAASSGLGTTSVNEQLVREATEANRIADEARRQLEHINRKLAGEE